jgi:hypothetical protein
MNRAQTLAILTFRIRNILLEIAKDEVKDMTESQKRCMIYWWYATNIYSICGKKHRMKLPDCLVNAVRTAYPEESGIYEGFCFNTE